MLHLVLQHVNGRAWSLEEDFELFLLYKELHRAEDMWGRLPHILLNR